MKSLAWSLALILIVISFQASALECGLKKDLGKKTLRLLKRAKNRKVFGILRAITKTKREYKVNILYSPQRNSYTVLLGEIHIKHLGPSILGKRINKRFKYRFLEGVPADEIKVATEELKQALKKRWVAQLFTFRFWGSTVHAATKKGFTIAGKGSYPVLYNKKKLTRYGVQTMTTADNVVDFVRNLDSKYKRSYVNLPLEVGEKLDSTSSTYVLKDRNVRMAQNIVRYNNELVGNDGKSLVIIGSDHGAGLVELLKKDNYKRCTNF